jgi:hypothetical protein
LEDNQAVALVVELNLELQKSIGCDVVLDAI